MNNESNVKVLYCNECAGEILIEEKRETPDICPHCKLPFLHGWDAFWEKINEARL